MKRIVSLGFVFVIMFMISCPVFAAENIEWNYPTDELVKEYAINYMTLSQNNESIGIDDFVHLYDFDNNLTGYYVTFSDEKDFAGYMLLSLISGVDPVVEFSFEGHGPLSDYLDPTKEVLPLASAQNDDCVDKRSINFSSNIVYTGPEQILIPMSEQKYYSVYNGSVDTINDNQANAIMSSVNIYLGIIDWSAANLLASSIYKINNFSAGSNYWKVSDFTLNDNGYCEYTALTNVLWFWGYDSNKSNVMNHTYGSTYQQMAQIIFYNIKYSRDLGYSKLEALKRFFGVPATPGGTWNYATINSSSSYTAYKNALNDDCPLYLAVHTTSSGSGTNDIGHGMFCLGHAVSTSGAKYLIVMDGWTDSGRIVKFDYYPYKYAYKIWVS